MSECYPKDGRTVFGNAVLKILRTIIVSIVMVTLLAGNCLPCRDLYGKSSARSCCDKSGACTRVPAPDQKNKPCPLEYGQLALEKEQRDGIKLHVVTLVAVTFISIIPSALAELRPIEPAEVATAYSPPPLYLLYERILV